LNHGIFCYVPNLWLYKTQHDSIAFPVFFLHLHKDKSNLPRHAATGY
jgi:hypothetical protein